MSLPNGKDGPRWLPVAALLALPPLVLVTLLWLPFGFRLGGLIEEWDILGLFATRGLFFLANGNSPLVAHAIRPLTVFPQAVAYWLSPDSFVWWHLLTMISLAVKGSAAGFLVFVVTRSAGWALASSLLTIVYPADTMQLAFRGLHINVALALFLSGGCLAVAAHYHRSRRTAALFAVAASILFLGAAFMYEAALALLPLPFLVLVAAEDLRAGLRRMRARPELTAMWLAAASLWTLNAALVSRAHATYQGAVVGSGLAARLAQTWPKLFSVAVLRALIGGWYDAWGMLGEEFGRYVYLLAAVLACSSIVLLARRLALRTEVSALLPLQSTRGPAVAVRLAVCGFLLLLLGYLPFLVSPSHMSITQRTYLFATPGAAFVCIAVLMMVAAVWRIFGAAAFAVLLLAGLAAQLVQFRHYVTISEEQRLLLRSIVENFSGAELGPRKLILLDGSNRLNHTWMLRYNLHFALSYLYGRPIGPVEICLMPSHSWQHQESLGRSGECIEEGMNWRFSHGPPVTGPGYAPGKLEPDLLVPANDAVVLRIDPDGSVARDPSLDGYREQLAHGDSAVARRYRAVLIGQEKSPLLRQFRAERETASYHTDFGRWWNMDEPIRGSGWEEAHWDVGALHHDAAAWMISDNATLVFDVMPKGTKASMRGLFTAMTHAETGIRLRLNGHPVVARWPDPLHFEADLPAGLLADGPNVLELTAHADPTQYGLAARMTRFEVDAR
jgi:hypothetical protein